MLEANTGIVVVASQYESGGQRAETLINSAEKALKERDTIVVKASKVVWDAADALDVCREFKEQDIDSLTIILSTWVSDSLLYVLVHEMNVPVVFWAVPYTETFSIGCVQHFGSILTAQGIPYDYTYGLPEEKEVIDHVIRIAEAGRVMKQIANMKLALVGPRQTWRVAGPQDMTNEEWEFSSRFGLTIVHIEMEEILEAAGKISDEEAKKTWKVLKNRTGKVLLEEKAILKLTRIYMAVKEMVKKYSLDALAAECYPFYSGLMNLPSSWLADEGIILDTEGDIGHTVVMYMLNLTAKGGATALGEVGKLDDENQILYLAHEGSTAHSLAQDLDHVQISPSGEDGGFVGLPVRPMEKVTVASIQGNGPDGYQMLVETGKVVQADRQEWVDGGEKLLVKLGIEKKPTEAVDHLIKTGMDHHFLVKEGDYRDQLALLCKYMGIRQVGF